MSAKVKCMISSASDGSNVGEKAESRIGLSGADCHAYPFSRTSTGKAMQRAPIGCTVAIRQHGRVSGIYFSTQLWFLAPGTQGSIVFVGTQLLQVGRHAASRRDDESGHRAKHRLPFHESPSQADRALNAVTDKRNNAHTTAPPGMRSNV
ncbi:hypothetical protein MHYP_G00065050 [Metynnis hypsauchen]